MTMIATSTQEALAEWEWESIEEEQKPQDGSIDYALIQVFVCLRSRTVAKRENDRECSWLGRVVLSRRLRFFRIDFLPLILQSEHIQIFPITVASTFVTLSWNSSGALSTGRGYILQVSQKSSTASPKVVPRTRQVGRYFLIRTQIVPINSINNV